MKNLHSKSWSLHGCDEKIANFELMADRYVRSEFQISEPVNFYRAQIANLHAFN